MSWEDILKFGGSWNEEGSRMTFDNFNKAQRLAFNWSFAVPHVIREKDGKFTVMMKRDTLGADKYGPIVYEERGRR
tara:strand:- start:4438 stop:4665 length:228 start_codon:yes stop_codon:yes gene_type:complete